ncbi:hypothetical protein [Roseibium sp. MMSF_3412]|uniref:hypothetical protein n=1 Tax=Roseibium sp. MMSF_3412 TaxID=3046712 RepID=UPI00273F15BC|nr:hypothetical protein [Roseibium sp. MMSF_3412]
MPEITEIFVLKMKDADRVAPIRERARDDYLSLDGITSWKTFVTTDEERPTLFTEVYTYPDVESAKQVTAQFSKRPATQAYLAEIEDVIVGQWFTEPTSQGETK